MFAIGADDALFAASRAGIFFGETLGLNWLFLIRGAVAADGLF